MSEAAKIETTESSFSLDATYSPEDNKLRLYSLHRLDDDIYQRVKEAGFKWAPKQELFVAPMWTPAREDLCIELAGGIEAEQSTMVERAEAKAERLDDLAVKRANQANSFSAAAHRISERFAAGQPILIGHHSERKARRDKDQMESMTRKAVEAQESIQHWNWKAEGVEHHANRKANPAVRARRIKTLLTDLRERQRDLNHAQICLGLWTKLSQEEDQEQFKKLVSYYAGGHIDSGPAGSYELYRALEEGEKTHREVVDSLIESFTKLSNSVHTIRWINHLLNRLGYERFELGTVSRFEGSLTAVILQTFTRTHGAHKPKATKSVSGWGVASFVPLPLHIGEGKALELSDSDWCDLMQAVGYEVPAAKARRKSTSTKLPLINPTKEEAEKLQDIWNIKAQETKGHTTLGGIKPSDVRIMKQALYSANSKGTYSPFDTIELDINGHRVWSSYKGKTADPVCRIRTGSGGGSIYSPSSIIHIEDKPSKVLPIEWIEA
jgi:hypothetical protein